MCTGGHLNRSGRWICRSPIDSGPRGRSILTTADYAGYGNSSGKVQFIVVIKNDIGESRLAFDAMATSTTVNGTMTYQAAVGLQSGVLTMRNRSFDAQQMLPSWTKCSWKPVVNGKPTVPTDTASSCSQLNQHTSRGDPGEDPHFQEFQVEAWLWSHLLCKWRTILNLFRYVWVSKPVTYGTMTSHTEQGFPTITMLQTKRMNEICH